VYEKNLKALPTLAAVVAWVRVSLRSAWVSTGARLCTARKLSHSIARSLVPEK